MNFWLIVGIIVLLGVVMAGSRQERETLRQAPSKAVGICAMAFGLMAKKEANKKKILELMAGAPEREISNTRDKAGLPDAWRVFITSGLSQT